MDILFDRFIDLLKGLIRQPSVVGAEHSFFRVLQRELEERGARVTWYEGVLVAQGNNPHKTLFSAHIDRHGLICTGPKEFQYAAFVAGNRSDLLGNSVSEELMKKIVDRFGATPVFAYEPWSGAYRGAGKIKRSYICEFRNNLIFELEDLDYLVAGTPLAFQSNLQLEDGLISGQLDNVLTAAVLVHLFELGFQGTAFFTAQEEAGKSWRYLLEWFRRFGASTDRLIVVDTSPYPDINAVKQQQVVLRNRDVNANFDVSMTAQLKQLCDKLAISYSFKDEYIEKQNQMNAVNNIAPSSLGSTELGRIVLASKGMVNGSTLQIPTSGYHTINETTTLDTCQTFIKLLHQIGSAA